MTDVIVIFHFGLYFALLPASSPENENIRKLTKTLRDMITLHKCTKHHDHRLYCLWDIVCAGFNCCFLFWGIFYPFNPVTAWKMKISENWKKKHLEISSFYTNAPKIMIIGCTALEKWHVTHVILVFHFGQFFSFLPP